MRIINFSGKCVTRLRHTDVYFLLAVEGVSSSVHSHDTLSLVVRYPPLGHLPLGHLL